MDFHFAIDLIIDIAAPDELALIIHTLKDFAANPLTYDLSEKVPDSDIR